MSQSRLVPLEGCLTAQNCSFLCESAPSNLQWGPRKAVMVWRPLAVALSISHCCGPAVSVPSTHPLPRAGLRKGWMREHIMWDEYLLNE